MNRGFESEKVWKSRGRGFSIGVVQPEGRVIHLTGQVAWNADEKIVGRGDVAEQTRQCFRNIENLLEEVGERLMTLCRSQHIF
ncbi:MAG: RidA family protein [Oceanospirillaceae bacterium]|nr:RidA family protein [Oceanospirillaceae bacterium]